MSISTDLLHTVRLFTQFLRVIPRIEPFTPARPGDFGKNTEKPEPLESSDDMTLTVTRPPDGVYLIALSTMFASVSSVHFKSNNATGSDVRST